MIAGKLIVLCWLVFYVYWLVSAFFTKRAVWKQSLWKELLYRLPIVVGVILLFSGHEVPGILVTQRPFRVHLQELWIRHSAWNAMIVGHTPLAQTIAVLVCVLGLVVAIWARRTLARNWSGNVTFKENHELVQRGPYRYVRHPIYTGLLMMVLGTAISNGHVEAFVGCLFFLTSFYIKLGQEEQVMLSHFPDQYPAYRSRSKALIPYVL